MKKASVVFSVLLIAATLAFAQHPGGAGRRNPMMERREHLKEDLHLTDQQESQIKKLHLELERKQAQAHSKIQLARLDVKEMYLSDKLDRSSVEKSIKQVSDLQHQVKLNFVDFWFSVNTILTPEQQKTWKHHLGEMAGEMKERMHRRMQHRGPGMPDQPDDQEP